MNLNKEESVYEELLFLHKNSCVSDVSPERLPNPEILHSSIDIFFKLLFPEYICYQKSLDGFERELYLKKMIDQMKTSFLKEIQKALSYKKNYSDKIAFKEAEDIVWELLGEIKNIRTVLEKDIEAARMGDPSAQSLDEIILSYPWLHTIMVHRVAHQIFLRGVPLIPRIMSEQAHSKTGIDIHPAADIGDHFFIDHGTGVVIGETCRIGHHVKLYQAVTLGALSFPKDSQGLFVKEGRRHPTIEDGVVIYAGATILGDICIGKNSVIGGNVWLTHSIRSDSIVTISKPDLIIRNKS